MGFSSTQILDPNKKNHQQIDDELIKMMPNNDLTVFSTNQTGQNKIRLNMRSFRKTLFILFSLVLFDCFNLCVNANELPKLNKKRSLFNDTKQCTNLAVNSNYIEFTILYKDNVDTVSECCEFCNTNLACVVWTLQLDIGRCLLKSNKGARIIDPGYISGFSERYSATLSTPIPTTTTSTTTVSSTTKTTTSTKTSTTPISTTTTQITSDITTPITKCEIFNGVSFGSSYLNQATNVTLSICCDFCADFNICKSYTYYAQNRTCLLYDSLDVEVRNCTPEEKCQSGKIFVNNPTTVSATIKSTTDINYKPAFGFYSMFDKFQLKISNLSQQSNYAYLNNIPLTDLDQISFLKSAIKTLEYSNKIYRILIDNMAYLPSSRSIVVSFMVVLDSSVQDIYEANVYLSLFNSLITNQVGFNNIRFYNEPNAKSDLLPGASYFSLRSFSLNDLDQFTFLKLAIGTPSNEITTAILTQAPSTQKPTAQAVTSDKYTMITHILQSKLSQQTEAPTKITTRRTTTITTTTTTTTTSRTTTTSTSTRTSTTRSTTTTISTSTTTLITSRLTSSNLNSTSSISNRNQTSANILTISVSSNNLTTVNQSTISSTTTFPPTKVTNQTTGLPQTTLITSQSQNTNILNAITSSGFSSLVDLSTQLSSIDKCWIEIDTLYLGPDLLEVPIVKNLAECCAACSSNLQCQSWVFNNLNQTCILKSSFRHGYYAISGYTSGFSKQPYESYIKVSNSLGIKNSNLTEIFSNGNNQENPSGYLIKDEIVTEFQNTLYNIWYKYLFSNIQSVELFDLSINLTYSNESNNKNDNLLTITYLLKIDPRISQNSQIIIKLINTINSTLLFNSAFYSILTQNLTASSQATAIVLPSAQISLIQLYPESTTLSPRVTGNFTALTTIAVPMNSTTSVQTTATTITTISPEIVTDFQYYNYQSGSCFIESNINYMSINKDDDFAKYYTNTREKCCFDCNRLEICKSWSYDLINQTCTLKKGYRSNPIKTKDVYSGFKPDGLFSLAITRGLEFQNVNNPIYDVLKNSTLGPESPENDLYEFMITEFESQISRILSENKRVNFIMKTVITDVILNDDSIFLSYELNIDPRFNDIILDLQKLMNDLYATPENSNNRLVNISLPFANIDETFPKILVPTSTSQFQVVATNTSYFPIRTTTPIMSTTISLDQYSKYLGCFNDVTSDRDLNFNGLFPVTENFTSMTIPFCIEVCRNLSQAYAGLQFGRECYCGSSYGKHGEADRKDCFVTCSGDKNSTCGGFQKNEVYSVGLFYTTSTAITTMANLNSSSTSVPINTENDFISTRQTSTSARPTTLSLKTTNTLGTEITSKQNQSTTEQTTKSPLLGSTTQSSLISTVYSSSVVSSLLVSSATFQASYTDFTSSSLLDSTLATSLHDSSLPTSSFTYTTASATPYFSNLFTNLITSYSSFFSNPQTTSIQSTTIISTTQPIAFDQTSTPISILTLTTVIPTTSTTTTTKITFTTTTTTKTTTTTTSTTSFTTTITSTTSKIQEINTIPTGMTTTFVPRVTSDQTTVQTTQSTSTTTTSSIVTAPTMLVSTSNGIISPRPIVNNPNVYIITRIKVNRTIEVQNEPFRTDITEGLRKAYIAAFARANSIFVNQLSRAITDPLSPKDIQIILTNITQTGQTNLDRTKNIVDLRYYVLSDNQLVSSEYAADSINLLSGQEMAQYLNQEVENQGYVELKPREPVAVDQKLWIIGAVLGPLALIFILFWIVLYIYYKCINPKKPLQDSKSKILKNESSPSSSQENIKLPKRNTKVKPAVVVEAKVQPESDEEDVLVQTKPEKIKLPDLSKTESIKSEPNLHKENRLSDDDDSDHSSIERSIRQKLELDRWRNKQKQKEKLESESAPTEMKKYDSDEFEEEPSTKYQKKPCKPETRTNFVIQTNNYEVLNHQAENVPNIIVSEMTKLSSQQHIPVKVHVANKPTVEDTTRVYNPYPLQNEYERYAKNGFFFEPLNQVPTKSSHSLDESRNVASKTRRNVASSSQINTANNQANVCFTSEVISPYTRKENSIYLKKPVNNDKLLDYARANGGAMVNPAFKADTIETEFQNFNHLKKKNEPNAMSSVEVGKEQPAPKSNDNNYQDEYDIINRIKKQTGNNPNLELINSIKEELKRLKTGYKPDSSNA